ncbi:MAG: hypothetical protein AB7O66_12080 [Limisphaerales bacterium]
MKNKPVYEVRTGLIRAAIWEARGENGPFFNVTVGRLFKAQEGWRQSSSFGRDDIQRLHAVLSQAHDWIRNREATK